MLLSSSAISVSEKRTTFIKASHSIRFSYASLPEQCIRRMNFINFSDIEVISLHRAGTKTSVAAMHYEGLSLIYMLQPFLAKEIRQYGSPHDIQSNL